VLFRLYAPLLAIYMRNFAYLCIVVWIHMDIHEYICFFFQNLNILCIFVQSIFWSVFFFFLFWFQSGSGFWG
jgi:hypothetical protein